MEADPRVGTCSGKPYFPGPTNTAKDFSGELISEACGDEMSVGMTKFYRTDCFQIGGFVREVMWDGIDCHQCRHLGWLAFSVDEPLLRFIHLRRWARRIRASSRGASATASASTSWAPAYSTYMTASAACRTLRPPYGVGGAAMLAGYLESMAKRNPRYGDEEFRRFLRRYQLECLVLGKKRATERLDARQASVWKPGAGR